MGINVINLGRQAASSVDPSKGENLAEISFRTYQIARPKMAIWMMNTAKGKDLLPWWGYDSKIDKDISFVSEKWGVKTQNNLFDLLFLNHLSLKTGQNFYVIMPGSVKSKAWPYITDYEKDIFNLGESCVFHLDGCFDDKFLVHWVKYFESQKVMRNPRFLSFWHMFLEKQEEADDYNAVSFFSMPGQANLNKVLSLLNRTSEDRSVRLAQLVDWFGIYSSPRVRHLMTACAVYADKKENLESFSKFQMSFAKIFNEARAEFLKDPSPESAYKVLTKNILL